MAVRIQDSNNLGACVESNMNETNGCPPLWWMAIHVNMITYIKMIYNYNFLL